MRLTEPQHFARAYGGGAEIAGPWIMRAEDIAGLTAQEIRDKFSLRQTPTYICDVNLPAGTVVEVSGANAVFGCPGGGVQYVLNDYHKNWFTNEKILP